MVKGISKQVIMVRSPDGELFDQAIFILKDRQTADVSDEQLLRQANRAVEHYVHTSFKGGRAARRAALPPAFYTVVGAVSTALVWMLTTLR